MAEDEASTVTYVFQADLASGQGRREVKLPAVPGQSPAPACVGSSDRDRAHVRGSLCLFQPATSGYARGWERLSAAGDEELDRVEQAPDARPYSRLSCQAKILAGGGAILCEVPAWNRNAVKE